MVNRRFERYNRQASMMSQARRLSGRKIAALAADGFEKVVFAESTEQSQAVTNHDGSDPQLDRPLGWALSALRWSPKPSAAALTSVAAAALASPLRKRVSIKK